MKCFKFFPFSVIYTWMTNITNISSQLTINIKPGFSSFIHLCLFVCHTIFKKLLFYLLSYVFFTGTRLIINHVIKIILYMLCGVGRGTPAIFCFSLQSEVMFFLHSVPLKDQPLYIPKHALNDLEINKEMCKEK